MFFSPTLPATNTVTPFRLDRVLVLIAVASSLTALWMAQVRQPPPVDLQPIRDELAGLRRELNRKVAAGTAPAPSEAVSPDGVTIRQVHEWAWGLEQRIVQLEAKMDGTGAPVDGAPSPPPDITHARNVATDPHAPVEDRLTALRTLRKADLRTSDIVQAMIELEASSHDPQVRADIFRQLSGVTDAVLKPVLIDALLNDEFPSVREEAAETLAPFLADPFVHSALTSVLEKEPDEKVRHQVQEILQGKP